jgi:hypothetical protein
MLALPMAIALGGCVGNDLFDGERPDDWQEGAPMLAFAGGKAHNADQTFSLRLVNGSAVPLQPVRCVAYQDGRHARGDDCAVIAPGRTTWDGAAIGGWTLDASWDGHGQRLVEDVEQHPDRRTVVAFDPAGAAVAYWDGLSLDEDGDFSTE